MQSGTNGCSSPPPREWSRVTVYRTHGSSGERLKEVGRIALAKDISGGSQHCCVFVEPECRVSKPWMGFGGSFTEASAETFKKLSKEKQEELLKAYFDPSTGLGFTLGRLPIGSCDFSLGNWTCGRIGDGDETLSGFSIDRYCASILPMIRRATEIAGAPLLLLASPWTPVPWMKTQRRFNLGTLKPEFRSVWAYHFVRFIEEMAKVGVPIWGVSVQNEPESEQPWESCVWTGDEERDFVRDHLGPALESAGLSSVKILIWDHNRDGMLERAATVYRDPDAAKYVWGVAYHWYGDARFEIWPEYCTVSHTVPQSKHMKVQDVRAQNCFDNVRRVAELRPDKHILFTEGCQELAGTTRLELGDWRVGERYAMNIIADLNSGCEGWIDWNLCLNEQGGPNHVGNFCLAPVILDTRSDRLLFQPCFWYLGHFARFIRPGARRVVCGTTRDILEVTAFVNGPEECAESLAVIVLNQGEIDVDFWFKVGGAGAVVLRAYRRSIQTFLVDREHGPSMPENGVSVHDASWKNAAKEDELAQTQSEKSDELERKRLTLERNTERRRAAKSLLVAKQNGNSARPRSDNRLWLVVGGGSQGGLIVRKGEDMKTANFPVRLGTGALVEEVLIRGNRLHYRKVFGEGPEHGWISMTLNDAILVEPEDSDDEYWKTS